MFYFKVFSDAKDLFPQRKPWSVARPYYPWGTIIFSLVCTKEIRCFPLRGNLQLNKQRKKCTNANRQTDKQRHNFPLNHFDELSTRFWCRLSRSHFETLKIFCDGQCQEQRSICAKIPTMTATTVSKPSRFWRLSRPRLNKFNVNI